MAAQAEARAPSAPAAEPSADASPHNVVASAEALDGDALTWKTTQTTPTATPATLAPPSTVPTVSGVPEPEEWLLLFLGLAVIAVAALRQRFGWR